MPKVAAVLATQYRSPYRAGAGHAAIIPAPAGYSVLTISAHGPDGFDPEAPVFAEDVLGFAVSPEHDAQGSVHVFGAPTPITISGTSGEHSSHLNGALKTPGGQVWAAGGECFFNSVALWEHALRQDLRTTEAAAHA